MYLPTGLCCALLLDCVRRVPPREESGAVGGVEAHESGTSGARAPEAAAKSPHRLRQRHR